MKLSPVFRFLRQNRWRLLVAAAVCFAAIVLLVCTGKTDRLPEGAAAVGTTTAVNTSTTTTQVSAACLSSTAFSSTASTMQTQRSTTVATEIESDVPTLGTVGTTPTTRTASPSNRATTVTATKGTTTPPTAQPVLPCCTVVISCETLLDKTEQCDPAKVPLIPADGLLLAPTCVTIEEGDSAFDVLYRVCRESGIHLEYEYTPLVGSVYIEGIGNLYEFDCGPYSGWKYAVNGSLPSVGCSDWILQDGDTLSFFYSCDPF